VSIEETILPPCPGHICGWDEEKAVTSHEVGADVASILIVVVDHFDVFLSLRELRRCLRAFFEPRNTFQYSSLEILT